MFLDAHASGKLHHAWLLAGPSGIGKAGFARAAATYVLASAAGPAEGVAHDRLHVSPDHRIARYIEAGSHPDLRSLAREIDDKGKTRANITIDQVRALQPLLSAKPSLSDRRAVIVDAADDLNKASANALLKNLEEPPAGTVFFLVSHSPGRLLPTIRSRCRMLRFQPLALHEVSEVLREQLPETDERERVALTALAEGSPGRALRFAGLDIEGLNRALDDLAGAPLPRRQGLALALAKQLSGKAAQPRYEAFLELVPARLAEAARRRPGALPLWEKAHSLASGALPLQLDPQSVAFELATLVAAA
jgi:DNA polymerase-3 subunit delta'